VIWNGAVVPETSARAPRSFDHSRQPITFGYLGRINVEKGVGTLIDAFRRIDPGNWQAKIAGQAPDSLDHFRKQAEGLPIEFVGWADPFDFLSELDVLIVPSIWAEPLPRSILEAYAMGVPVIGARSGGIPDLIGAHNEDWLFEPGNDVDLTQKLQQAIRAGRAALPARDAFDSVFQETRPTRVAEKYLNLYREVLALRAPQIATT
jgi:glycosyltransferase involved in cell wall biosynthesis